MAIFMYEITSSAKDEIAKLLLFPSSRGGVDATSIKYRRRHPLIGADGVVRNISDHPVCASKVASQLFLDRAASPPLEEGNSSIPLVLFRWVRRLRLCTIFCNSPIL